MLENLLIGDVLLQRIKISKLVIVEGKYDKIRLSNIIDAQIIPVNGFSVFNDSGLKETLKKLALEKGVLILTDSDTAGYKIRVYLTKILGNAEIINVLAPPISGKEKRKTLPSAQGLLGIEGISDEILYSLLLKYASDSSIRNDITSAHLYELGFSGKENSGQKKRMLTTALGVQPNISNRFLLRILNERFTLSQFYDEFSGVKEDNNDK